MSAVPSARPRPLHFAAYVTIADTLERRMVRGLWLDGDRRRGSGPLVAGGGSGARDWALATSTVRRDVFYYRNLPLGEAVLVHLVDAWWGEREVKTHVRLVRERDALPLADLITSKTLLARA